VDVIAQHKSEMKAQHQKTTLNTTECFNIFHGWSKNLLY